MTTPASQLQGLNAARTAPPCAENLFDRDDFLGAAWIDGAARFRLWAPDARRVEVCLEGSSSRTVELTRSSDGYFVGEYPDLVRDARYKYRVDGEGPWPDPCSRFQPEGPHGPSLITAPNEFAWRDASWRGARLASQIIYELHIGTFTAEGTFDAAAQRLEHLADLGITMLELLPVAECAGRWNWGYDGVQLFAPSHGYGDPEAFKRFVDRAHALGMAVILDVVYNHLGPDGNYLKCFSPHYFSDKYRTDWGEALNFDGAHCVGARDFVINNAKYWLREFHLDGFRLDATQSMFDASDTHVIAQLVSECRAAVTRDIVFIAENEPQRGEHLLPPARGGYGLDGMWNDDFHHSVRVALTGSRDGYYRDYTGRSQELLSAIKHGFLYQGQYYSWQKQQRGSPLRHSPRSACVHFLQNHDQVGNTGVGERLHPLTSLRRYRAATALLLLGPQTPLLFMGQEFLSSKGFTFFADHKPELRKLIHRGRREFVAQFEAYATQAVQAAIPDPGDERTFLGSKLDWDDLGHNAAMVSLHKDLIRLRREDPVFSNQDALALDGATLTDCAFLVRWFASDERDRMLIVNFGPDAMLDPVPEPLLAPPLGRTWQMQWASEDPRYGGHGVIVPVSDDGRWRIPAECAVVMHASARRTGDA
jgi:maltooligosyltrehalose trehalohydrolase